jgi:large subunit ribosomal protein L35
LQFDGVALLTIRIGFPLDGYIRKFRQAEEGSRRLIAAAGPVLLSRGPVAITRAFNRRQAALLKRPRACLAAATSTKDEKMPKLKTKSGAKKRFDRTATGKIKRNWGHKRHRLISKSKAQKRLHRGTTTLEKGDAKLVLTYMPYLRG